MKLLALALLLVAPSAFAETKTFRHEVKPPFSLRAATPAPDSIRTYSMVGSFAKFGGKPCLELFDEMFSLIALKEGERERIYFTGFAACSQAGDDSEANSLWYSIQIEARTEDDIELVDSYLESHKDLMVEGNALAFVRVFGIMNDLSIKFQTADENDVRTTIGETGARTMYVNIAQLEQAAEKIQGRVATVDSFLDWLGALTSKAAASYYRQVVLPQTNIVTVFGEATLIMDDRTVANGLFVGPYDLDCRGSSNGYCL